MNKKSYKNKISNFGIFVAIVCALTNLSQMPYLVQKGITQYLSYPVWILLFIVCMIKNKYIARLRLKTLYLFVILFFIYSIFAQILSGQKYLSAAIPSVILISTFVAFVGGWSGDFLEEEDLQFVFLAYIISGTIVCGDILINHILKASLESRLYAYQSKNSVSQILLTVLILIIFEKLNNKKNHKSTVLYLATIVLIMWTLVGLKSRATLISIPIIIIWGAFSSNLNKSTRSLIIFATISISALLILKPSIYKNLVDNVFLAGRSITNLDDVSSGRIEEWENFITDFSKNPFFGKVSSKRESLILSSFLQHGFFGGILIISIAMYPLLWFKNNLCKNSKHNSLLLLVTICYLVNGLFEQLAPFGPGVKCYFLWFMLGIFSSIKWVTPDHSLLIKGNIINE